MDVWSWICELPNSDQWIWEETTNSSHLSHQLAANSSNPTQSVHLRAERIYNDFNLSPETSSITFSVQLVGFHSYDKETIWASDTCPLSSDKQLFLPLILQLLQEIVSLSPTANNSTCPRSQLKMPKSEPVSWILDSHSTESFASFFTVVFLTRLFWIFAFDAPSEVGSFYFHYLLAPNLETFSFKRAPALKNFFTTAGTDLELCLVRSFGYMLVKWLILRDVEAGFKSLTPLPSDNLGFSYSTESHGLWVMKSYAPVKSLQCVHRQGQKGSFPHRGLVLEAQESLLKYALAHQQLEAVIQLEYAVKYHENFIQVNARVDNIRLHVVKLGFKNDSTNDEDSLSREKYFPSRIRIWVGPEVGASYVGGLSLTRPTENLEREVKTERTLKGISGKLKTPKVKATAKTATRSKIKNWRWDQDVEGNSAIFDAILCDNSTGAEIATWRPTIGEPSINLKSRCEGFASVFTKSGGLILGGEEYGESVVWRLSKDTEGSVLKWRMGGQVWLSYLPNDVVRRSSYYETRFVEWCDEVDLPLIPK